MDVEYLANSISYAAAEGIKGGLREHAVETLRAEFAGRAMQAILSTGLPAVPEDVASHAVACADALLVALGHEAPKVEEGV